MDLNSLAANAAIKYLNLTPAQVQRMLAEPDENWIRLIRHMEAMEPGARDFIAQQYSEVGHPPIRLAHLRSRGDHDPKFAAFSERKHDPEARRLAIEALPEMLEELRSNPSFASLVDHCLEQVIQEYS